MSKVIALLQSEDSSRDPGAPAVAGYEFQSSTVLQMLKGLHDKFRAELAEAEKGEMNQAHAYSMLELHLSNTITADTAERDEKAAAKGKKAEASTRAKGQLVEAKAGLARDE